jgi:hypothetical protein
VASALEGQASDARLRLKGDLRDFPFIDPAKGQFQVTAKVSGAVLTMRGCRASRSRATWPSTATRSTSTGAVARFSAQPADVVTLPSMTDPDPHLLVEGGAEGPPRSSSTTSAKARCTA